MKDTMTAAGMILMATLFGCSTPGGTTVTPTTAQAASTVGGSQGTAQGTEGMTQTNTANHIPIFAAERVTVNIAGGQTSVDVTGSAGEVRLEGNVALDQKVGDGAMANTGSSGGQQGASAGSGTGGSTTGRRGE